MTYGQPTGESGDSAYQSGPTAGGSWPIKPVPQPPPGEQPPPRYLEWALIVTILAVVPFCSPIGIVAGIVALVYSGQVRPKWYAGDFAGAAAASRKTKIWAGVATGIEVLFVVGAAIYIIVDSTTGGTT